MPKDNFVDLKVKCQKDLKVKENDNSSQNSLFPAWGEQRPLSKVVKDQTLPVSQVKDNTDFSASNFLCFYKHNSTKSTGNTENK